MDRTDRHVFGGRPRFRGAAAERLGRARHWCLLRTQRDARHAAARGRPISPTNQRRMLMRRWTDYLTHRHELQGWSTHAEQP